MFFTMNVIVKPSAAETTETPEPPKKRSKTAQKYCDNKSWEELELSHYATVNRERLRKSKDQIKDQKSKSFKAHTALVLACLCMLGSL